MKHTPTKPPKLAGRWTTARSLYTPSITGMDIHTVYAMAYEAVFIIIAGMILHGLTLGILWIKPSFESIPLDRGAWAENPALIDLASQGLIAFVAKFGLVFVATGLAFVLAYSVLNSMIWARLNGHAPDSWWIQRWTWTSTPVFVGILFELIALVFTVQPTYYILMIPAWYFVNLYSATLFHLSLTLHPTLSGQAAISAAFTYLKKNTTVLIAPLTLWTATYIPINIILRSLLDMTNPYLEWPYLIVMTIWLRRYVLMCAKVLPVP